MSEKMLDLIWSLDIDTMNDHLPRERKTLKQLLSEDKPFVLTKKNQKHVFRKEHIEIVKEIVPKEEWANIKFPIIILRRTSLDKGIFSVSGGVRELFVIHKITGKTTSSFHEFIVTEHKPYIWKPIAFTAVRKIGSLVVIGYT